MIKEVTGNSPPTDQYQPLSYFGFLAQTNRWLNQAKQEQEKSKKINQSSVPMPRFC
jgi:hypothetical protein